MELDLTDLAVAHMQRRTTEDEEEFLSSNIEEWRKELIRLLNRYHSELETLKKNQARDNEKYKEDPHLQEASWLAWEEKRRHAAHKVKRAEYDLALIDQQRHFKTKEPPSERERFLQAAIEAHRDFTQKTGELRSADKSLYDALQGKWTFTDTPEITWQSNSE